MVDETVCRKTVRELELRDFEAEYVATREEALKIVLDEAAKVASVGWGGSETLKEIGVRDALVNSGKEIRDHRLDADLFLLSANAVTSKGIIVNIDGTGNRVAASICGSKRVLYVIGANKIVEGGVEDAIERVKRCACPPNCHRLGKHTPCAITGLCADCGSVDCICKVTAVFERRPTRTPTRVVIVGESLGY